MKQIKIASMIVVLIFVVAFISIQFTGNVIEKDKPLKIGAILPLSGPAAIWGESIMNGMELAKQDLNKQGISVDVVYEDSRASPSDGLTAYTKLADIDRADIIFSAFSRVSIPLIPLAEEDNIPLIMTVVAADGVAEKSPYAFRIYSTASGYAEPHFHSVLGKGYREIAILSINDEYGNSVSNKIKELAYQYEIEVVTEEKFEPGNTDFRSSLTKIKEMDPDGVLIIAAVPPEIISSITQIKEMGIESDVFESSVALSVKSIRESLGESSDGVYTLAFPFTLDKTGQDFKKDYKKEYGTDPLFSSAFGYDMTMIAAKASGGRSLTGKELVRRISELKAIDSLNGLVEIQPNGEINPELVSVRIIDGKLILNE
jgi:branched-chain amino acid transport system substrate-binding protein